MILVLRQSCNDAEVQSVVDRLGEMGMRSCVMKSADRTLVSVSGDCNHDDLVAFNVEPLVEGDAEQQEAFEQALTKRVEIRFVSAKGKAQPA